MVLKITDFGVDIKEDEVAEHIVSHNKARSFHSRYEECTFIIVQGLIYENTKGNYYVKLHRHQENQSPHLIDFYGMKYLIPYIEG